MFGCALVASYIDHHFICHISQPATLNISTEPTKRDCVVFVKTSFATHSNEPFFEPLAVLPDPSLELLNFSTGVNSTPESEVFLIFSSIIIPSEEDRLCFEVAGLLAGRGNTLERFRDPLESGSSA